MKASIKSPVDIIADTFEECGLTQDEAKIAESRLAKSLDLLSDDKYQYVIIAENGKLNWGHIRKEKPC